MGAVFYQLQFQEDIDVVPISTVRKAKPGYSLGGGHT